MDSVDMKIFEENIARIKKVFADINNDNGAETGSHCDPPKYDIYERTSMIDRVERLGIARHFRDEIKDGLPYIYRYWTEHYEGSSDGSISLLPEIANDFVAFRVLRLHGYDVSPGIFWRVMKVKDEFLKFVEQRGQAVETMLNIYRASQLMFPGESILQVAKLWSKNFLDEIMSSGALDDRNVVSECLAGEVKHALDIPWRASLERLDVVKYTEHLQCGLDATSMLENSIYGVTDEMLLALAKEDFKLCQAKHKEEIKQLRRWYRGARLNHLKFARQRLSYCYMSAGASFSDPQLSLSRIAWSKNCMLTLVMDDLFDEAGTAEEHQNLVEAVKRWDPAAAAADGLLKSDNVKIIFSAIYSTTLQIAQEASLIQGYDVSNHLRDIWTRIVLSMMKEAEWTRSDNIPSSHEYIENGKTSFVMEAIVLPALYFVGPILPEQIVRHPDYQNVIQLVCLCGRILNDIQSSKWETSRGKVINCLTSYMKENPGVTVEDSVLEMRKRVDECMQELLRQVLRPNVVPRECKELHLHMARSLHFFYLDNDGLSFPTAMIDDIKALMIRDE